MATPKNILNIEDGNDNFNTLCERYLKGKAYVDKCQEELDAIRRKITDMAQLEDESEETEYLNNNKYSVKITHRINRKFIKNGLEIIELPEGLTIDDVFAKKYEFNMPIYRKLSAEAKASIDKVIVSSVGKAGFEISEKENTK